MRSDLPGDTGRMAFRAIGLFIALIIIAAAAAGCGGDDTGAPAADGETTAVSGDGLDRSVPGKVTATDASGDAKSSVETGATIPGWLDITSASVASDGNNVTFQMVLAEPVPQQKPADIVGVEWGYHIDVDMDGEPDFGLYAAFPKESMTYGLYNHPLQQRLDGSLFPGLFTAEGNTLTWTFEAGALGAPATFQWAAYSDAGASSGGDQPQLIKTGDKIPDNSWPDSGWFVFP